jgi:hypothetical protein
MEFSIGILWPSEILWLLGGDYWLLMVFQIFICEHESCEAFGSYYVKLLHACMHGWTLKKCIIHQICWWCYLCPGTSLRLRFCIHVRSGPIYWGGYLPCKNIMRWWYFTCKNPENIICDGILHINMFHYFKIPYFTCNFFTKLTYNEYIGPYFLSHVVLRFLPSDRPEYLCGCKFICMLWC